ncbi:hypothetical protein QFZ63_000122 [Streptomyces sp. B3I7]|uniref:hypothetical protein n=1 Tax=Streptomyces sp. B3I7 TaxID=3042269 RepID=UPI00277D5762|nr:hypothetical protein [Streptomyces sp. B3I7]MDQ0808408.1 hypothetical protein [Streptomyces sp. B3I7]
MPDWRYQADLSPLAYSAFIVAHPSAQSRDASGQAKHWTAFQQVNPDIAREFVSHGYAAAGRVVDEGVQEFTVTPDGYRAYDAQVKAQLEQVEAFRKQQGGDIRGSSRTVDVTQEEYDAVCAQNGGEFPRPIAPDGKKTWLNLKSSGPFEFRQGFPEDRAEVPTSWIHNDAGFGYTANYGGRPANSDYSRVAMLGSTSFTPHDPRAGQPAPINPSHSGQPRDNAAQRSRR